MSIELVVLLPFESFPMPFSLLLIFFRSLTFPWVQRVSPLSTIIPRSLFKNCLINPDVSMPDNRWYGSFFVCSRSYKLLIKKQECQVSTVGKGRRLGSEESKVWSDMLKLYHTISFKYLQSVYPNLSSMQYSQVQENTMLVLKYIAATFIMKDSKDFRDKRFRIYQAL